MPTRRGSSRSKWTVRTLALRELLVGNVHAAFLQQVPGLGVCFNSFPSAGVESGNKPAPDGGHT